ncbi:MAG: hypothetical protein KAG95_05875 [Bacteroidales bacterium]|nr:hypothetical protein [Bacteroidales bacterium]
MILSVLKKQHPYIIFVIPLITLIAWSKTILFHAHPNIIFNTMPFYDMAIKFIPKNSTLSFIIAVILIIIQAYIIIRLNFQYMFLSVRTYLPAVFFIIICSLYLPLQTLHPVLFANLFFLLAFDKALTSNKNSNLLSTYFMSGFLLSLGSLFYFNLIFFLPIIWISKITLRGFNFRELFISIIGLATPYFFLLFYYFYFDKTDLLIQILSENLFFNNSIPTLNLNYVILFSFMGLLILISSFYLLSTLNTKKIITRKYFRILLWLFIFSSILFTLIHSVSIEIIVIVAIPISFLLANYFASIKSKWWGESLFTILILLITYVIVTN